MKTAFLFICIIFFSPSCFSASKVKFKSYDKISLIKHPLMIKAIAKGEVVQFQWSEPHHDFTYFLEIYHKGKYKPFTTISVKGRSKKIKFKNQRNTLYWRVFAKSKNGYLTSNKRKYVVPARPLKTH